MEKVFKHQGHKVRPFMKTAKVSPRGSSTKLQRIIVDFGADGSFRQVIIKVMEHYGLEVTEYAVRKATLRHGQRMLAGQRDRPGVLPDKGGLPRLIGEMDGCLLPIVETSSTNRVKDRRKRRSVSWRETRLCLMREPKEVTPIYGCTGIGGSTSEAGQQLERCAILAGASQETKVHGIGDGACWIADQFETVFGAQATYLVDLYHVCEYLAAAAASFAKQPKSWVTRKKNQLKKGLVGKVLDSLRPNLEPTHVKNEEAPVQACYRYLSNRLQQLDYKTAIENQLPIGSGEIESAHRHVLQARLKLAGAWWKIENANKVIALRVNRANGQWDAYWRNHRAA